jgi:hypothetical protein
MNDISPKDYNFICVILGDNDFISAMYQGMYALKEKTDLKSLCPFTVKLFMIESIVHYYKIRGILNGDLMTDEDEISLRKYIASMRVLLNEKFPTIDIEGTIPADHDGGAIYIDVNTGFISSF